MKTRILFTVILVMVAAMTVAPEVSAQEQEEEYKLEEITVTATKRETTLEDTALALSVVSGDMISEQGRNDIWDILKDIPGVNMSHSSSGLFKIRGVSGGILFNDNGDPGVSVNVDGTYVSNLVDDGSGINFYDMARAEVLRGPQGTLYGRNAEAGVFNVITNDPTTDRLETSGTIEVGSYHLIRGTGMVNTPLSEHTALRAAFQLYERYSYYTNGGGAGDKIGGRVKYLYHPNDTFRLLVGAETSSGSAGSSATVSSYGTGDSPVDPYDNITKDNAVTGILPSTSIEGEGRANKLWAQFDWETPIGTVTYLPSYNGGKSDSYAYDRIGSSLTYELAKRASDNFQRSFEARLASSGDTSFDYVFGIFYLDAETSSWDVSDVFEGQQETADMKIVGQTSKAVFGQGTYDLTDRLRGTLGLRYTKDEKDYFTEEAEIGIPGAAAWGDAEWTRTDWKVGLEMDVLEDSLVYLSVATGYRPGTINTTAGLQAIDTEGNIIPYPDVFSKPEEVLAYEMGAKTSFFNKRLTVNGDLYFYDYTDRQYQEVFPGRPLDEPCPSGIMPTDIHDPNLPNKGTCYMERNMAKVETYGGEVATVWRPTDNGTVNFSVAYLEAHVAESQVVVVGIAPMITPGGLQFVVQQMDVNGETMPESPKWMVNASYEHRFDFEPGSLFLRADGRYTSEQYLEAFNHLATGMSSIRYNNGTSVMYRTGDLYVSKAHTIYDVTATYLMSDGHYSVTAYVKNITDDYYKIFSGGAMLGSSISAPRTYGATFTARF